MLNVVTQKELYSAALNRTYRSKMATIAFHAVFMVLCT
jgi:hypothetical protein